MAQGNTYPVVGSASYSSLESRRLPSVAPPTRDTTFNPHTPPMASYYYHCARAACLFHLRPPPPLEDVQPPPRHVESRRSHSMRRSPFVELHRPRTKTVRCVNTTRVLRGRGKLRFPVYLSSTCRGPSPRGKRGQVLYACDGKLYYSFGGARRFTCKNLWTCMFSIKNFCRIFARNKKGKIRR